MIVRIDRRPPSLLATVVALLGVAFFIVPWSKAPPVEDGALVKSVEEAEPLDEDEEPPAVFRWPEFSTDSARLTWPKTGPDAGALSVNYELERRKERTNVARVNGSPRGFTVKHNEDWLVSWHPLTPDSGWAVTWDATQTEPETYRPFAVGHWSDWSRRCSGGLRHSIGYPASELRAETIGSDFAVYQRGVRYLQTAVFGADCRVEQKALLPAEVLEPVEIELQQVPSFTPVRSSIPSYTHTATTRHFSLTRALGPGDFSVAASERTALRKFAFVDAADDRTVVALLDDAELAVYVLDPAMNVERRFAFTDHQPWKDPLTHLGYHAGFLTVRGSLDEPPWNASQSWLRVYDVDTGDLVAEVDPRQLEAPVPPAWRWPAESADVLTNCSPVRPRRCQHVVRSDVTDNRAGEDPHVTVRIEHEWSDGAHACRATIRPPLDAELRPARLENGHLALFGRTRDALFSWSWDLDCNLVTTQELPRSVLFPRRRKGRTLPFWEPVYDVETGRLVATDSEE